MVDAPLMAVADTINQLVEKPPSFVLREFPLTSLWNDCGKKTNVAR
jgi:hypothetical protein